MCEDAYELREIGGGYDFMGKNSSLSLENMHYWDDNDDISGTQLGQTPRNFMKEDKGLKVEIDEIEEKLSCAKG